MFFNTTYTNKEFERESRLLVGKKFSFLQRLQQGGIGSSRLMIHKTSKGLNIGELKDSDTSYGNIERRPKGIIVHCTNKQARFSWVIPFYRLAIYSSEFYSIHGNGEFIQFSKNRNYDDNKKFLTKIQALKNDAANLDHSNR